MKKHPVADDFSDPVPVPFLRGHRCSFLFEEDPDDPDVRAAMKRLLNPKSKLLAAFEPHVVAYCKDVLARYPPESPRPDVKLEKPGDVWSHVDFGFEFAVTREEDGIYFSLECNCDWEEEHGLQLVIRDGHVVVKVGPFDGHLTNSRAFGDPSLRDVVYVQIGSVARRR